MSFVDLLFLVGLFLPTAVVVVGGILLALPRRRRRANVSAQHAHAH